MMNGHEKSDSVIVAEKPANKAAHFAVEQSAVELAVAEPVERRAETKGNADQQSTCRAQSRVSVSQALDRIRKVAKERKKERFTALFHHRLGVRCRSTLAQQCRSSCREWVPTSLADNKCATCFQILITCSIGQEPADSNDIPYAVPKGCLAAHAECTANCRGQTAPTSGTPNANAEKPK